jgi:hypothetical protein
MVLEGEAGGILCGHACECRPTRKIREMVARDPNADCFPVEKFKFAVVYAGSIVAVDEFFTGVVELVSDKSLSVVWSSPMPVRYAYD